MPPRFNELRTLSHPPVPLHAYLGRSLTVYWTTFVTRAARRQHRGPSRQGSTDGRLWALPLSAGSCGDAKAAGAKRPHASRQATAAVAAGAVWDCTTHDPVSRISLLLLPRRRVDYDETRLHTGFRSLWLHTRMICRPPRATIRIPR